ncbi:MAG: nickel ABC transporter permease subunit NikB, partial [Candidatus Ornithomonoglobus sp.]
MKKYILKKILTIIPVMLIVSILTFGLVSIAPSDPAQIILGANGVKVTEEALELKREELGLNDPIHVQYLRWLK